MHTKQASKQGSHILTVPTPNYLRLHHDHIAFWKLFPAPLQRKMAQYHSIPKNGVGPGLAPTNNLHSIRVRRTYCSSCELLLGWLNAAQLFDVGLGHHWWLQCFPRSPQSAKNTVQTFFLFHIGLQKCFRICFDNIALRVLCLHPRFSCVTDWKYDVFFRAGSGWNSFTGQLPGMCHLYTGGSDVHGTKASPSHCSLGAGWEVKWSETRLRMQPVKGTGENKSAMYTLMPLGAGWEVGYC